MLSENRKQVYADNRYNNIHYRSLPEIHFTASGFSLKTFDRLCVFVFVSFWSFFASLHIMKSKKKKTKTKTKKNKKTKKKNKKKTKKTKQNKKKKQQKKKNKHINYNNLHDLQTGRTNTLLCRSFSDYHVKSAYSLCVIKKSTSKCTLCINAQSESCLAYKETKNGLK